MTPANRQRLVQRFVELRALENEIGALRDMILAARRRFASSMRKAMSCPACGSATILEAQFVLDRGDADSPKPLALQKPSVWRQATVGNFAALVCQDCGFVEWSVPDREGVTEGADIRRLDASSLDGAPTPYR